MSDTDGKSPAESILAIDRKAPVQCELDISIDASPKKVWAVLSKVSDWHNWMDMISASRLEGELTPGSIVYWSSAGMDIRSRLAEVNAGRRLAWQGTDGAHVGIHIWDLKPQGNGTLLRNSESIHGAENPADHQEKLIAALTYWNQALKTKVESQLS